MLEELMLEKKVWAVVGANQNPDKYGNMIYKKLKSKGYEVYAVNPLYDTVEGDPCYKDLSSLPKLPDVIDMVVSQNGRSLSLKRQQSWGLNISGFSRVPMIVRCLNWQKLGLETYRHVFW